MMDDDALDAATAGTETEGRYRHLIEHIQDAIVEFRFEDGTPVVRHVNDAFVDVFGYDRDELYGESLNEWIVPDWQREEARQLDQRTGDGEVNYQRVQRETADGLRRFLYRGVPYDDETIALDGAAIYTDLTDITRQRRQLRVMNRVLRHNLRNRVNVITGNTTHLLASLDEQTAERTQSAASIEQAARDLEELTTEARKIEDIIEREPDHTKVDCVSLLQTTVSAARDRYPSAVIETTLPEALEVKADSRLRFALESLIENAIEHNPAATPSVRVCIGDTTSNGWVDIYIDDDGPRIPLDERKVISADAEITPTRHGSGLGLWLVKWTIDMYGGELSITTSDLGGNRIALRLQRE